MLERGQWWVSHEMPTTTDGITAKIINIDDNNPYEIMNNIKSDGSLDLDARLSITEIEPQVLFSIGGPLGVDKKLCTPSNSTIVSFVVN
jgi:hypothetical protein